MEVWKEIDGYHLISNYGNIKSFARKKLIDRKASTDKGGYKAVVIRHKKHMVHVLVAKAFIQNPNRLPEVNHIDSNPSNNKASNLEWVSEIENVKHAILNSYKKRNGKHWKSKISTKDADFIRKNFKKKYSAKELAAMFKLDLSTIYSLLRGETWNKHNEKIRIFGRCSKLE